MNSIRRIHLYKGLLLITATLAMSACSKNKGLEITDEAGLYKKIAAQLYVPSQQRDLLLLRSYVIADCGTPPPLPDTTFFMPFSENDTFRAVIEKRFMPGLIYDPGSRKSTFELQDSLKQIKTKEGINPGLIIMSVRGKKTSPDSVLIWSVISSRTSRAFVDQLFVRRADSWSSRIVRAKAEPMKLLKGFFYP